MVEELLSAPVIHMALHVLVPAIVARTAFADQWKRALLIMLLLMTVDLDHLLASPIYDPNRCSIGFHPLHSYPAIGSYLVMLALPRTRIIGAGLLIHMALDWVYCIQLTLGMGI